MHPQVLNFKQLAKENLENQGQRLILGQFSLILKALRDSSFAMLPDGNAVLEKGRAIREYSVDNLPYLLEQFEENATKAGAKVIWANDAKQANDFILSIVKKKKAKLCVKGKSMISEEIGLREELIAHGIDTYETDLGEFIVQLSGRSPFHIVGPAINMTVDQISDMFTRVMGSPKTSDPVELARHARAFLRDKFEGAQIGITGVNMAVAETGSIVLVENEGNIRFATSAPKTHIALMSLEKVVPTLSAAVHMLKLLTRSCTGQRISSYVSVITGPKKDGELDGPEELYIVIVDNGRTKIYSDEILRSSLRCIKCGLCAAVCPVYTKVGGYAYGWVYSGPIGAILNPLLLGLDKTRDLYHATTLCGACKSTCPGGVDLRNIFLHLREKEISGDTTFDASKPPLMKRLICAIWAWLIVHPFLYKITAKLVRMAIPIAKGRLGEYSKMLSGWAQFRDIPESKQSFRDLYGKGEHNG